LSACVFVCLLFFVSVSSCVRLSVFVWARVFFLRVFCSVPGVCVYLCVRV